MSTVNNDIPFVPENTTDPSAGLNQALNVIDALLQIAVLGIQNDPPGSPSEGDRYIVSPTGTAQWAGRDNQLARWQNGAWQFYDARIAVNLGDSRIYSFDGAAWTDPAGGGVTALQPGDNVSELVNDAGYVETVNGEAGPTVVLDADDIDDAATTNKFATQAQLDAADGALQAVNNLLDVADAPTARTNLGLGTAAVANADDFATGAEGDLAASAVQPGDNVSDLVNNAGYITSSSVVTDHGTLTGLGDDDHTQYYNQARGDARYAQRSNNLSDLASAATARTNLGLGTFATYNYSGAPFINVMPDSGRFAGKMNPLSLAASGSYSESGFFSMYNGATSSSAGKFIHDNTTHGGSAGALTATVDSLLAAMSRSGNPARYGVEFYVSEITAGAGTASPNVGADSVTRYLLTTNGNRSIFASSGYTTCSLWINVASGSAHINSDTIYVNGVQQPAGYVIPFGWHHVRVVSQASRGYDNAFPYIRATSGAVVEIAVPSIFTGIVDTGIHTSPIPTINELSA